MTFRSFIKTCVFCHNIGKQIGINRLVLIECIDGESLVTFPPDIGQELLLNFIVEQENEVEVRSLLFYQ